eukprot:UN23862
MIKHHDFYLKPSRILLKMCQKYLFFSKHHTKISIFLQNIIRKTSRFFQGITLKTSRFFPKHHA